MREACPAQPNASNLALQIERAAFLAAARALRGSNSPRSVANDCRIAPVIASRMSVSMFTLRTPLRMPRWISSTGTPNATRTSVEGYYHSMWPIAERWVYDASFVKLRELRIGYTAPVSIANRVRLSGLRAAVVGRNLALWADVPNIDPETALSSTNLQGIEMGQLPSTRSIGFQISVTP